MVRNSHPDQEAGYASVFIIGGRFRPPPVAHAISRWLISGDDNWSVRRPANVSPPARLMKKGSISQSSLELSQM
jgi:hypothetical protein